MMLVRLISIVMLASLAACGSGSKTCDEGPYQEAVLGPRIVVPEDLDNLEQIREMPLPAASPQAPRPEGSPCIEKPPPVLGIS
jgi:uncharacterized lipoprotein